MLSCKLESPSKPCSLSAEPVISTNHDMINRIKEAIRKIKKENKECGVEQIIDEIKYTHASPANAIAEQLNLAVDQGIIEKTACKGSFLFRVAGKTSPRKQPPREASSNSFETDYLTLRKDADITPLVTAAVASLSESGGSTLKNIECFIVKNYTLECADGVDLSAVIRSTIKSAVSRSLIKHEGRFYAPCSSTETETETDSGIRSLRRRDNGKNSTVLNGTLSGHEDSNSSTPSCSVDEDWHYEVVESNREVSRIAYNHQLFVFFSINSLFLPIEERSESCATVQLLLGQQSKERRRRKGDPHIML